MVPNAAVSTAKVLLVPYDCRHVLTYHTWMEDPAIQEATASEWLTLDEEYENQTSWRASHDKLTFIVCQPLEIGRTGIFVKSGVPDTPERMLGDVNLFLYPDEDDEDEEHEHEHEQEQEQGQSAFADPRFCVGEVDIMIADQQHRGKGLGRVVMQTFLQYISRNLGGIMHEYAQDKDIRIPPKLKLLMAKINKGNTRSIALFSSLGFEQEGEVNYFGEVKLVLRDLGKLVADVPEGYAELVYSRSSPSQDEQQ
ncbi:N-acetyltransferase 9-like protein [Madurella mycetomatis]|uniref:N-acetyltransferase 9-like protein n=1 Tax=Madurella mycetomatis TaxID=100816 RepID=A0A175VPR6_9PEZI|nr:N-acetyltransferase 9-like protein [Madurella mycetomatis]KXX78083.1 N-acetyltransferase 9-like protein [Madurella mycetomatis]